ncbi:MAG: hypothetical protein JWM80_3169 [Cyanobacteria bacterium RYN_339]|nr:hypothetical protein [Cyanobacteria bacterium RYN_339]
MKTQPAALALALALLAGCPSNPTKIPTPVKALTPKPTKPSTGAAPSPSGSREARPTLPPASFPPVVVPSPPPSPQGVTVSTIAGKPKVAGFGDGAGASAMFERPQGIALGPDGNLYVADTGNHRIRKIDLHDPGFAVTTAVGNGVRPSKGGLTTGPAESVYLRQVAGLAFLPDGRLLIADIDEKVVRVVKFDPAGSTCLTFAGSGEDGTVDGPAATATFGYPTSLATAADGTAYVADSLYNRIRSISPALEVKTVAGSGPPTAQKPGGPYDQDGPADKAIFSGPCGVAVAPDGTIYVADSGNSHIRRIKGGQVSTVAGGVEGYADGFWRNAQFTAPLDIKLDLEGNVLVPDGYNHRIRRVTPLGDVVTLAGSGTFKDPTLPGDWVDGPAATARFDLPNALVVGPDGAIYVADQRNHCIRKITVPR